MKPKISDLWRWQGTVERGVYLFWGICLFIIKYNLDRWIGSVWFDQHWMLFDVDTLRFYVWQTSLDRVPVAFQVTLLALSLPFLWSGIVLTLRRLRSLGWKPWWLLVFFMPFVKLFFFAALCLLPSNDVMPKASSNRASKLAGRIGALIPSKTLGSAVMGVAVSVIVGIPTVWLGTSVLGDYGWALFVGLPFVIGFISVLIHCYHAPRSIGSCVLTAIIAIGIAGGGLLLVAMEGVICLIMAAPIALLLGIGGGSIAYLIQNTIWQRADSAQLFCVVFFAIPVAMGVEHVVPPSLPKLQVQSSVIVDAPPEKVWQNVIAFSELPPPNELIFKLGVAFPVRAEIDGHGVGAVRHCDFSTGPFVEPIEVWDEPRLLKFSVTENPEPLQEWTPYQSIHPPHLHGYLQSCGGQFRLIPLAGNRTLLEGTTWYYHHLWPADYWQLWSDQIIHTIHLRVLNHVKKLSEAK